MDETARVEKQYSRKKHVYEEVAINLDSSDNTVETTVIHMETGSGLFMLENIDYENTQLRIP